MHHLPLVIVIMVQHHNNDNLDILRYFLIQWANYAMSVFTDLVVINHYRSGLDTSNLHERISKLRLVFLARREPVKKRSIHVVCEHFEPAHDAPTDKKIDAESRNAGNAARGA